MIIKIFTKFYPVIPLWNHPKSLVKDLKMQFDFVALDNVSLGLGQPLWCVGKGKDPKKHGKEEEMAVKMPGFVSPETMNEEGYFTQKAKQQLEELKKRGLDKPNMTNPEKKE